MIKQRSQSAIVTPAQKPKPMILPAPIHPKPQLEPRLELINSRKNKRYEFLRQREKIDKMEESEHLSEKNNLISKEMSLDKLRGKTEI